MENREGSTGPDTETARRFGSVSNDSFTAGAPPPKIDLVEPAITIARDASANWRAATLGGIALSVVLAVMVVVLIGRTQPAPVQKKTQLEKIKEFEPRRQMRDDDVRAVLGQPDRVDPPTDRDTATYYRYGAFGSVGHGGQHFTAFRWNLRFVNGCLQSWEKRAPVGQDW